MDVADYLPMFLAEAREHLQELNLAIVRLEEHPDDRATLDEVFRIAHSVKGMSATMGFEAMAALTHELEDVLETLRGRGAALEREAVDVLLACLDALSSATDAVEEAGAESLPEGPALIARLHALTGEAAAAPAPPAAAEAPVAAPAAPAADVSELHLQVELSRDCEMPSVRAFMVLAALAEHGEVVSSTPDTEALGDFTGRVVAAVLRTTEPSDAVLDAARDVPDVTAAIATSPAKAPVAEPAAPAEAAEDAPAVAKSAAPRGHGSATVRVDADRLDQLLHHMGELVLHRTQLEGIAAGADVPELSMAMQGLTRTSQALQAMVMQIRMMPVQSVFVRFPRLVRDLSSKLGKQVELELLGGETELDRTVIDALGDPLMHLIRNSLDHGLESAEDRVAAGKPAAGRLTLSAQHVGGNVVITVADDGRGVNPAKVAERARERGLLPADAGEIDEAQAIELLFTPGFSTAEVLSDVSGRGVGMDAVRATVRELGGEVVMTSELGKGTNAHVRLPLTLAIMSALVVEADGAPLAIPLDRVESTLRLDQQVIRTVTGSPMLVLRDGVLPLIDAASRFGRGAGVEAPYAVVVRSGARRVALRVTGLVGQRELVTRPLPPDAEDGPGLSGAAVMADGDIALILDCDELLPASAAA